MEYKHLFFFFFAFRLTAMGYAQNVINVWPKGNPTNSGLPENEILLSEDRISQVTIPTITVYHPRHPNGMSVLCFPGGGYALVSMGHEGNDWARWFADQGITYMVLKYRMPNGHPEIPMDDAREAMNIIVSHAHEWNIDVHKIGVLGFSAGGHLATWTATHYYIGGVRPAFQILFYPVITMDNTFTHEGSRENLLGKNPEQKLIDDYSNEKVVNHETGKAFILACSDDPVVNPRNAIVYYQSLLDKGVSAELHLFASGGHGWGNRDVYFKNQWEKLLSVWLKRLY